MKDQWLTDILGMECYTLTPDVNGLTEGMQPGFSSVKISTSDVAMAHLFQDHGFRVVDTAITMVRPAAEEPFYVPFKVREARPEDFSAVVDIAESAFCSRFHLDPRISPEQANAVKRAWIGNYLTGERGERLFVRHEEGRPVGFLGATLGEWEKRLAWVIDLIAVASEGRGQGVGVNLVAAHLTYFPALPAVVGTQARNVASMALYSKMGFRVAHTAFVLHAHRY